MAGASPDGSEGSPWVQSRSGSGRGTAGTGKAMRYPLQGCQGLQWLQVTPEHRQAGTQWESAFSH